MILLGEIGRTAWAHQKLCPDPGEMEKLFVLEFNQAEIADILSGAKIID
jgi:hypothetical protein